jgi:hypothetical protein
VDGNGQLNITVSRHRRLQLEFGECFPLRLVSGDEERLPVNVKIRILPRGRGDFLPRCRRGRGEVAGVPVRDLCGEIAQLLVSGPLFVAELGGPWNCDNPPSGLDLA